MCTRTVLCAVYQMEEVSVVLYSNSFFIEFIKEFLLESNVLVLRLSGLICILYFTCPFNTVQYRPEVSVGSDPQL
jgi:hypothetical protein